MGQRQHYPQRGGGRVPFTTLLGNFFLLLVFFYLSAPGASILAAQEIVILKSADITAYNEAVIGFKSSLPSSVSFRDIDLRGDVDQGKRALDALQSDNDSLVLAVGLKAAMAAKEVRPDLPVVYCMVLDPKKYDLHRTNMIGITLEVPVASQLDVIRSVVPTRRRIGVLFDPGKSGDLIQLARDLAKPKGLTLVEAQVQTEKDVPAKLRALLPEVDLLWLIPDSTVLTEESFQFLLGTSLDHNVPVIGFSPEFVRSGALASVSVGYRDVGEQAAAVAREILTGPNSTMPGILDPEKFRLTLNLKTARFLGLTLSPQVIRLADQVY